MENLFWIFLKKRRNILGPFSLYEHQTSEKENKKRIRGLQKHIPAAVAHIHLSYSSLVPPPVPNPSNHLFPHFSSHDATEEKKGTLKSKIYIRGGGGGKPRHFSRRQKELSHPLFLVFRAGKNGGVKVRSGFGSISLFFSSWFSGGENGTFFQSWREKKKRMGNKSKSVILSFRLLQFSG